MQKALINWAKSHYSEPKKEKRELKSKIAKLQCTMEQKEYYQNEKAQEEELYNQLSRIKREEEEKWRIKSRQMWLESGDKNTSFFHK